MRIKKDLALNNLQWLICCKTKPNQTKSWRGYPLYALLLGLIRYPVVYFKTKAIQLGNL